MNENEFQYESAETTQTVPYYGEPAVVTPKKREVNLLLIGLVALVAVAILGAVVVGILTSSPWGLVATSLRNSAEAIEENQLVSLLNKMYNGGSSEISMDLEPLLAASNLPLDGTGSVKMYMDTKNQKSVLTLGVKLGQLQKLDANVFFTPESMAVSSQAFLGSAAYGIDMATLLEDFNKSVFRMDGPYSLGIELPDNLQTLTEDSLKYAEEAKAIFTAMSTRLLKTLEENSEVEKANGSLTLGGEEVKTTTVTIKLDHKQIAALATDAIEYMRTDEDFRKFFQDNADYIFASSGMYTDPSEQVEDFFQELDRMANDLGEMEKELESSNASVALTFHISKSGKQMIGIDLTMEANNEPVTLNIHAGPDLKEAKEIRFRTNSNGQSVEGTYTVKVDDKNKFVALLDFCENGKDLMKADISWDKQSGALELVAANGTENSLSILGSMVLTNEKLTAAVQSITADGNKADLDVSIVLQASDAMPTLPAYKNILKMSEAEVGTLVEELSQVALQLAMGMLQK